MRPRKVYAKFLTLPGLAGFSRAFEALSQKLSQQNQAKDSEKEILNAQIAALTELLETSREINAQLLSSTEDTINYAEFAANKGNEISERNKYLATSIEQMGAGIKEVAEQATASAGVVKKAQGLASDAVSHIQLLGGQSKEVGGIVQVITSIAHQTKLLALNATIEAARAGDAGKGFAVVANEVKELAKETATATEDISNKISSMRESTQVSIGFIQEIAKIIDHLESISMTIASSVEEQAGVSREIGLNANSTAVDSTEITVKMQAIKQYNQAAAEIIEALQGLNQEMVSMAGSLIQE